jgi:hypothetical protein
MGPSLTGARVVWIAVCLAVIAAVAQSRSAPADSGDAARALNADLLAHDSASEVLGRWCVTHHLADPPVIKALRDRAVDKPAGDEVRGLLRAPAGTEVRYRRVRLVCGDQVLSEADNWYVPARLTDEMNHRLEETDTPFGLVVKPLGFHRQWLGQGDPLISGAAEAADPGVFRHAAVLIAASGLPFSVVVETYRPASAPVSLSPR